MKSFFSLLLFLLIIIGFCQTAPGSYISDLPRGADIVLAKPASQVNVDLIKAYQLRKSTKYFTTEDITFQQLSTILWSANGINRKDGKRTAPSPFGEELVKIYVFSNFGIYRYNAKQHTLHYLSSKNAKKDLGAESGARGSITAALVLLLTGDLTKMPDFISRDVSLNSAHATAGAIGQNVYLIANALELSTRFVGSINTKGIRGCLELSKDEVPLYIMPLGHKSR
jgi:SagB-type dehydrogenase family enzyme